MVKRDTLNKIVGVGIAGILILFIFTILIPPTASMDLTLDDPSPGSTTTGGEITFSNVNITIKDFERIPLLLLNFTIYTNSDTEDDNVSFEVDGTILDYSNDRFEITAGQTIQSGWYTYGYGYDEGQGDYWGYGYGYGYGDAAQTDITLSYTIVYTTHTTGTYYGKLFAVASLEGQTLYYDSSATDTFTVTSGGGGGNGGNGGHGTTGEYQVAASQATMNAIQTQFGVTLTQPITATDTDGDGKVDFFNDPNGVLTNVNFASINGSSCFLISTNDAVIPEFFWNTNTNTITPVSYAPGDIKDTYIDTTAEEVTIVVDVNKGDWIYIDIADAYPPDAYPNFVLTVKTSDGRVISPTMIWRQNDNIYVLDDPTTQYVFVYKYDILPPTINPPNGTIFDAAYVPQDGTTFNIARPTITITYFETVTLTAATLDGSNVINQVTSTDQKTFIYTPTSDLANGKHVLSLTVEDPEGNIDTSSATYFIELPTTPAAAQFPWIWIIIIAIIIIIAVILILRKLLVV